MVDQRVVMTERDQAKILAPLTQELVAAHHVSVQDIDRFAIATGPGSFTGLRVGLAFVRGLALATGKPAFGSDHFVCTQHAATPGGAPVLMVMESKRAELFACLVGGQKRGAYFMATAPQLVAQMREKNSTRLAGNGVKHVLQLAPELAKNFVSLPPEACAIAAAQLAEQNAGDAAQSPPQPLYIREADVTFPT